MFSAILLLLQLKHQTKLVCFFLFLIILFGCLQEEGEDSFLDTSDGENETVEEDINSVQNAYAETSFPYNFEEEPETESADPQEG